MIIKYPTEFATKVLSLVKPGEAFLLHDELYMKIKENKTETIANAINLETGDIVYFDENICADIPNNTCITIQ